jgi:hypothetical protein
MKNEIWIIAVSSLFTMAVVTVAIVAFGQAH